MIDQYLDAPAPKPNSSGGYVVGLVYDKLTSDLEANIMRDLLILNAKFPLEVNDYGHQIDPAYLDEAQIERSGEPPVLNIVYRTEREWPYSDPGVPVIKRDLFQPVAKPNVDPNPKPGYALREQGRDGANLTELFLNRTAPRGNGLSDAFVVLLWGR